MSPLKNFEWILFRPHRHDLLAEVERVERLDHHLAALLALELIWARIFEVRHHVIDRRFDRVGRRYVQLHVVTGIGHLGARNYEACAFVQYVH